MKMNDTSCFTLSTCLLIHFFIVTTNNWIYHVLTSRDITIWNAVQGLTFLMYPLFGLIADVCITQYRMIKLAFCSVLVSSLLLLTAAIIYISKPEMFSNRLIANTLLLVPILITGISGFGMYEANAIQFGMDQMLEASSRKLSSFIHWYYWSLHLGPLMIFYILLALLVYMQQRCTINLQYPFQNNIVFGWMMLPPSIIQCILIILGLCIIRKSKNVYINPVQSSPFKLIINVIKFAWKHKYPVNRSAFTYWENDIPSRINLGKHKYGGPFTNEQVEDVKTLLQLLILIMSLFGFQLSGDGYSLSQYMMNNLGCPATWTMLLLVVNPEHVTLFIILIGIPLYQLCIKNYFAKYTPNLLKRVHFGLFICLIQEGIYPIISLLTASTEHISQCYLNELTDFTEHDNYSSITTLCLLANTKVVVNGTCETVCPEVPTHDNLFLLLIIPQILHGLAYLLVFVTVLEFICAQAPYTMKGLLIGIWYSTLSIKYLVVNILDGYMVETTTWNIYHGVKGLGIFLSIVSFSLVCTFYRYRERDEIVNEQAIIEEQYERELLYNREEEEELESEEDELTQLRNYSKNISRH